MSAIIYNILKEFFVLIHEHPVKARIMSPVNDENSFTFQISLHFKNNSSADANIPNSTFTSYATAERHLLGYLDAFQNTMDLGGSIAEGTRF
ncbi:MULTISPECIES: hypothetical protein [unclassified Pedobacter]|uniref:hypothetical protein n=1 Tax=Pedobacter TaxID=84567 RepID=UPI001124FCC5|nr:MULTISPECIES: hypothetical protein [unclassified Pedobacter]MCX2431195.1 hypothetical protein [Pedobacter sp. GR22-10]